MKNKVLFENDYKIKIKGDWGLIFFHFDSKKANYKRCFRIHRNYLLKIIANSFITKKEA